MYAGRVTTLQPLQGMINGGYAVFVSAWQKKYLSSVHLSKYSRLHSLNLDLQSIWIERSGLPRGGREGQLAHGFKCIHNFHELIRGFI